MQVSIARRYARALHQVALKAGAVDPILAEVESIAGLLEASSELRQVFESPAFSRAQRTSVLDSLATRGGYSEPFKNFLRLLADRDRTSHLPAIARLYRELADESAGRVRAEVITPYPLSDADTATIQQALARATGKTIVLTRTQDESLLGGMVAHVGDTSYDGSLKTQLKQLRARALGRAS